MNYYYLYFIMASVNKLTIQKYTVPCCRCDTRWM